MVLVVAFCSHLCTRARSWRKFAKSRFKHFPSILSVHVDSYDNSTRKPKPPCISSLGEGGYEEAGEDGEGDTEDLASTIPEESLPEEEKKADSSASGKPKKKKRRRKK